MKSRISLKDSESKRISFKYYGKIRNFVKGSRKNANADKIRKGKNIDFVKVSQTKQMSSKDRRKDANFQKGSSKTQILSKDLGKKQIINT